MRPKDFIKTVFMTETMQIVHLYPYISFMVIGIGIEFLGKCIDKTEQNWNKTGNSKRHFKLAINELASLSRYRPYLNTYKLYNSFRCGLVHAASPNFSVTLSSKNEMPHLNISNNRLNLKVEDFYTDFYDACDDVIKTAFPISDKMNLPFLQVPEQNIISNIIPPSGTTRN